MNRVVGRPSRFVNGVRADKVEYRDPEALDTGTRVVMYPDRALERLFDCFVEEVRHPAWSEFPLYRCRRPDGELSCWTMSVRSQGGDEGARRESAPPEFVEMSNEIAALIDDRDLHVKKLDRAPESLKALAESVVRMRNHARTDAEMLNEWLKDHYPTLAVDRIVL